MSVRISRLTKEYFLSIIPPDFSAPSPSDPSIGTQVQITIKNKIQMLYLPLHLEESDKYDTFLSAPES